MNPVQAPALLASRGFGAALLALALLAQALGHHNTDISWLLTVCERMLAGERAYVDILEVNPPASILLYMPAALLAHVTPLPAEFHAGALTFLAAGASLAFCARIVRGGRLAAEGERGLLLNLGVYALALAPGLSFAQREHFALLLLAPALCVCVARAQTNPVSARHAILAGLLGGWRCASSRTSYGRPRRR